MIKVINLIKNFGEKTIFRDTDFVLPDCGLVGIVGESGSGKTTLINLLSLLDSDYSGEINVDGVNLSRLKKKKREAFRREHFCYVFADSNLLSYLSPEENVFLPLDFLKGKIDEAKYAALINDFNLHGLSKRNVDTLSEGEKQRFSVLRALMANRSIMVCDEPTAHLDHKNAVLLMKQLKDAASKERILIITTCHDNSLFHVFDKTFEIKECKINERKTV